MTKEEIASQETMGIFDEHELGITGLANAMDIYAKQQCVALLDFIWKDDWAYAMFAKNVVKMDGSVVSHEELYNRFEETVNA